MRVKGQGSKQPQSTLLRSERLRQRMEDNLENKVPDMEGCTRPRDEKGPSSLGPKEGGGATVPPSGSPGGLFPALGLCRLPHGLQVEVGNT